MPQSLVQNYLHIVFSTKKRQHLIDVEIVNELYSYLGSICNKLECQVIKVGGYTNHIHILCLLSKKITLIKIVEQLKSNSSKWIKTKANNIKTFTGKTITEHFGKSVASRSSEKLHRQSERASQGKTFKQEYRALLKKYKVKYDERYVWD